MKYRLSDVFGDRNVGESLLYLALFWALLIIAGVAPLLEPGGEMAIVMGSVSIAIVSMLALKRANERAELLREQNEKLESLLQSLEGLDDQIRAPTRSFQQLPVASVVGQNTDDIDDDMEEGEERGQDVETEATD